MIVKKSQVAAQLYTVRDHMKSAAEIRASLKKIRRIGYEAVEVGGSGPLEAAEMRSMLEGEGLVACSSHEPSDEILAEPKRVAERLHELGIRAVAYPSPSGVDLATLSAVKGLARKLDRAGKVLREAGVTLAYHNHDIEFRHVSGRPILETIYEHTDSENLKSELDTYWVQVGGSDPVLWIERLKKRLPLLHLKDLGIDEENRQVFREIGYGNLAWEPIVRAAKRSGCKWYIVEQDACFSRGDPFRSLKMSFEYILEHLCV